jgi:hypothetical protein
MSLLAGGLAVAGPELDADYPVDRTDDLRDGASALFLTAIINSPRAPEPC